MQNAPSSHLQLLDEAWFWLSLAVTGNAGGNVLMKYASRNGTGFLDVYFSAPFIAGGLLFGGGLMCYMRALAGMPLAVAYLSVVGLSIVAVTTLGLVLFGERLAAGKVLGIILIFAGVALISRTNTLI
jgi:multidrug transporter EmrE-like cation transporter